MSSFSTNYQPTPVEQAYSLYLLETVLKVAREPFRLSGRIAVPFLSSSGVDRTLLRAVWTLVDPKMEGSLVTLIQFTSVLKLVSLAQLKWLDLEQYEGLLQFRQVPLATFANLVVPNNQYLLQRYPFVTNQMPLLQTPMHQLSVSDAFGDLDVVDAPMPTLPTGIVDPDDDDFGDMQGVPTDGGGINTDGDELGDFSGAVPPAAGPPADMTPAGDFGGFVGAAPVFQDMAPVQNQPLPSSMDNSGAAAPNDNSFGDFEGTGGVTDGQMAPVAVAEDSFGDFEGTPEPSSYPAEQMVAPVNQVSSAFDGMQSIPNQTMPSLGMSVEQQLGAGPGVAPLASAFDTLQPVQDQPLPHLGAGASVKEMNDGDDFGNFEGTVHSEAPREPLASAFDSLQQVENQPLPAFGAAPVPSTDSFGGFEGTVTDAPVVPIDNFSSAFDVLQPVQNQPLPALDVPTPPQSADDDFGDFEGTVTEAPVPPTDNLSSAFDALQPVENQPLSALGAVPPPADDDFGDFEGTTPEASTDHFSSAFGAPIENQPLPALDAAPIQQLEEDDDFGDFEGSTHEIQAATTDHFSSAFGAPIEIQPLSSLEAAPAQPATTDNDFGGFGGSIGEIPTARTDHFSSAFGTSVENQPLPPLGAVPSQAQGSGDEFGAFEGSAHEAPPAVSDHFSSAFGAPVENQPLPSLGGVPTQPQGVNAGGLGGFEGTTDEAAPQDHFSAAFGASVENQPLPALGAVPVQSQGDNDDFGDFEGTTGETSAATTDHFSSTFGDPIENQPLPALGDTLVQPQGDVDDFGDFEGSTHEAPAATTDAFSSAFGAPVENQPLPSLDSNSAQPQKGVGNFSSFGDVATSIEGAPPDHFPRTLDAIQPSENQPSPALGLVSEREPQGADDFGDFEGSANTAVDAPVDSVAAAFAETQPVQNQSLPSPQDDDDDDFGDFEGVDHTEVVNEAIPAPLGSAFDGAPTGQDQTLPSIQLTMHSVDDFGSSEAAPDIAQDRSVAQEAVDIASSDPFSSGFGSIEPIQDQPLPSLGALSSPAQTLDADEDFGDFEGTEATPPPTQAPDPAMPVADDEFGGFGTATTEGSTSVLLTDGMASVETGQSTMSQPTEVQDDDDPFSMFEVLGAGPTRTLAPLSSFNSQEHLPTGAPLAREPSFADYKTPTGDLSPALGMMSAPPTAPADGDITSGVDDDDFGDFKTPVESIATTPVEVDGPDSLLNLTTALSGTASLQQPQQPVPAEDDDDFGDFEGTQESTAMAPADEDFGNFGGVQESAASEPADDSFGNFEGVQAPADSVPAEDSFGDFEGVEAKTDTDGVLQEADTMNDFGNFGTAPAPVAISGFDAFAEPTPPQEASNPMDDFASFGGSSEPPSTAPASAEFDAFAVPVAAPPEQSDDDDWGDFEHVQVPAPPEPVEQGDEFADFASAPAPTEGGFGEDAFAKAPPAAFDADFGDAPTQQTVAAPTEDDFGDWDSFQDAPSTTATPSPPAAPLGPPQTLEEIRDRLGGMQLPGSLAKINVSTTLGRNIITPIRISSSSRGSGGSSTMVAMQRAKRCYQLVTLLSSNDSSSQLVLTHWKRVITVARDELTMASFLLQQGKKLVTGSSLPRNATKQQQQQQKLQKEEIKKSLSTMVASLGECVRVVRSIVATVADIMCLDLGNKKVDMSANKEWMAIDVIQLSGQVEELWKTMLVSSKKELRLSYRPTSLESCVTIQNQAWQPISASSSIEVELCNLTLQPLVQEKATSSSTTNTKSKVHFHDKPFMACAANLWANRVSADEAP